MYRTLIIFILCAGTTAFGSSATVTWEANPELIGSEMRIYQVSHTDENIVGYDTFDYSAGSGTFEIMDRCMGVSAQAYRNGVLSEDSNSLNVPCTSPDCYDPDNPVEARITAFSANELSFNVVAGKKYEVYCRSSLSFGEWESMGVIHSVSRDGALNIAINTSEDSSCFYTVVPVS